MALVGVFVIINPKTRLFQSHVVLIGLLSALFMAISTVLLKYLVKEKEPIGRIIFYQYLWCSVLSIIFLSLGVIFKENFSDSSLHLGNFSTTLFLIMLGILSVCAQFTLSRASQYLPAGQLAPFFYASVPISSLLGWVVWKQTLSPGMIIGSILIFIGICICTITKRKTEKFSKIVSI